MKKFPKNLVEMKQLYNKIFDLAYEQFQEENSWDNVYDSLRIEYGLMGLDEEDILMAVNDALEEYQNEKE